MKKYFLLVLLCVISVTSLCIGANQVYAENVLSLSVTPPLFQVNMSPGEAWKSSIKVINSNAYDITVYAELYNFEPSGEDGQGTLVPLSDVEPGDSGMLGNWISVTSEPIVIHREQSVEVPVTVALPQNAPPGGHYAALLIGTHPPEKTGTSVVRTSQVVTSLFFVRVAGDIHESGSIREFSVAHMFRESPEADFSVRFQNTGNVHLQPQGGITIYNMWGQKIGEIPINQKSHFGNVLPSSIRKFEFSWSDFPSLTNIGRFTAEVALLYGQEGKQTATATTSFWVIPLRATAITLLGVVTIIGFIIWIVRRYVRSIMRHGGYVDEERVESIKATVHESSVVRSKGGILDLRKKTREQSDTTNSSFLQNKKYFVVALVLVVVACVALIMWWR